MKHPIWVVVGALAAPSLIVTACCPPLREPFAAHLESFDIRLESLDAIVSHCSPAAVGSARASLVASGMPSDRAETAASASAQTACDLARRNIRDMRVDVQQTKEKILPSGSTSSAASGGH